MTNIEYENLNIPCFKSAILNLTDSCNCNCRYCFMDFNPKQMTFETAKQSIDWLYRVWLKRVGMMDQGLTMENLPSLTFFGGEPTLRWDDIIIPSLEYISNVINPKIKKLYPEGYMGTNITTNGTLLTPDRIRLLKLYNCPVLLSIDGDKETQDFNRPLRTGGSSFDLVEKNIPSLLHYFPNTTFRSTIIPATVHNLYDNFIFAIQSGFTNYFATPNKYEAWSKEDLQILREQMYKIGMTILYFTMEEHPIHFSLLDAVLVHQFSDSKKLTTIHKCGLGTQTISIGADGNLYGCQEEASKDNTIYHIGHLDTGIDKEKHLMLLNQITQQGTISSATRDCSQCPCQDYCSGNYCTVSNLATTGDPLKCGEIECEWKNILHDTAKMMLYQAELEKSDHFIQYLLDLVKRG